MGEVEGIFASSDDAEDDLEPMEDLDPDELMDPLEIDLEDAGEEDLELGIDLTALDEELDDEDDELLFGDGDTDALR